MSRTPALDYLVRDEWSSYGPGTGCADCPFNGGGPTNRDGLPISRDEVANDPEESNYNCSLLKRVVWGEDAPCDEGDWRKRGREELRSSLTNGDQHA